MGSTKHPFIVAVCNQKGGVAKTTSAECLAACMKKRGLRVLAIDMDPQGNLSDNAGAQIDASMYDVLHYDKKVRIPLSDAIQSLPWFDIAPSTDSLAGIESQMITTALGAQFRLRDSISNDEKVCSSYDLIVIDCSPSLGMLTINALTAADVVLIPSDAATNSAKGVSELKRTIAQTQDYCNSNLRIAGVLITRFDARTNIGKQFSEVIDMIANDGEANLRSKVYKTHIRKCVAIDEAHAHRKNILIYSPQSNIVADYEAFADEFYRQYKSKLTAKKGA